MEMVISDCVLVGYTAIVPSKEKLDGDFSGYKRRVKVYEVNPIDLKTPFPGSGYKKIEVIVDWGKEDYQEIKLSTLVTSR